VGGGGVLPWIRIGLGYVDLVFGSDPFNRNSVILKRVMVKEGLLQVLHMLENQKYLFTFSHYIAS
jgi:hypothetical protein